MENDAADGPKEGPAPPNAEAGALGVPKERLLLPLPTAPGTGVLCPKVGAGVPPNTGLVSGVLGTAKANGVLWFCAPSVLCVREEPKGVAAAAAPLCPAPKLNATAGEPLFRAGALSPKPLAEGPGWAAAPKVKGEGVVPKTAVPALLLVVCVLEPKLTVVEVAVPKEKTGAVVPNTAWALLVPKALWVPPVPKGSCALLPNAGWVADCAAGAPKLNTGPKPTGPAAGLLVGSWLSAAPALNAAWPAAPGYGGGGFALVLKELPKAETEEPNVNVD